MPQNPEKDRVDAILEQWQQQRPDLDVSPMAILGRISRAERLIHDRITSVSADFQLERWGFDVLATLRRSGPPYRLTPTQLYNSLMLTSGAMTNRIDRLEELHLVERQHDPVDRRGVLVSLTQQGLQVIDAAVTAHMEAEEQMLAPLSGKDREKLADLLRVLVRTLDNSRNK